MRGKLPMDHGDPVKLFLPYAVGWLGWPTRHALKGRERSSSSDQGGAPEADTKQFGRAENGGF